ncbi:hypothetical protein LUX05_21835 [Streptomyces somaliensis]|nr:hypothetical protein [Streptomyces somaliensis]
MKTVNALAGTFAALALAACAVGTARAADGDTPGTGPGGWFRDCNIVEDADRPNREVTDEYVDCSRNVGDTEEETGPVPASTVAKEEADPAPASTAVREAFPARHHEYR